MVPRSHKSPSLATSKEFKKARLFTPSTYWELKAPELITKKHQKGPENTDNHRSGKIGVAKFLQEQPDMRPIYTGEGPNNLPLASLRIPESSWGILQRKRSVQEPGSKVIDPCALAVISI